MMVRILHFIDTLGAGGAERQLVYLLENLERRRFEPHVVTTYDEFRHHEAALRQLGVPLYSLHHGPLNPRNRLWALTRYIQLMRELRPQIVHSWLHYPNLIARFARPFCPEHRLITAIRSRYNRNQLLSEWLTRHLSDIRIVNYKTNQNPTTFYIPNAIAQTFFATPIPKPNGLPPTALMLARIDQGKGHDTVLKALAALKQTLPHDFQMLLIGQITAPAIQNQLNHAIDVYQLGNIVQQLPPQDNLIERYAEATVTLLPSESEGFSNVMLESLASGTPVITSTAANHIKLIAHGENGWVFPTGDSGALAVALQTALSLTEQERTQMAYKCRATATPFTITRMVKQYEALYSRAWSSA